MDGASQFSESDATQCNHCDAVGPGSSQQIEQRITATVADIIRCVRGECDALRLCGFEQSLWSKIALLYRLFVALFLAVRHERLDVQPHLADERYRLKDRFAPRTIKTFCGLVAYGRAYLLDERTGHGWFPLDALLGITQDGFSLRVIGLATRLATRVSYQAAVLLFKAFVGWAPSPEAIECLALGLGRRAGSYMEQCPAPEEEGEVLVIEIDGKAIPTATAQELAKRRGPRQRHEKGCLCGCQRHRGQRKRRGKKRKRRRKGDKSKNGRSATLVVMYTLKRGPDGLLHGPLNKKVWALHGPRRRAFEWARAQATKRGFPPDTKKTVQIVVDGEKCLEQRLRELFPNAIFTLDLRHAQERLWKAGRQFYAEGSAELAGWVEPLNTLLLAGQIEELLARLRELHARIPRHGPNTKRKRDTIAKQIAYLEPRAELMRYDKYRQQDLVLASGAVEGAARYVVGERFDCAGMRWICERSEPLLHLRCIELNGDWDNFLDWVDEQTFQELQRTQRVQIRTQQPSQLGKAA
jgi:hypothetical protein